MSKAQELKPELLPCPMCGGAEILMKKRKTTMVECKACGVVVFNYQDGIERDAIAHWNRRAPASSEQQAAQQDAERWRAFSQGAVFPKLAFNNGNSHWQYGELRGLSANAVADLAIAARASNGGK